MEKEPLDSKPAGTDNLHGALKEISWAAPEYHHHEKTPDWYWAVGVIALSLAVSAVIFGNVLFAVLVIVGTVALVIHAVREPRTVSFALTERGVVADDVRHTYQSLESFWVADHKEDRIIIFQSKKMLSPYLIVPLGEDADSATVRNFLLAHLPEEEHEEPYSHKIMAALGF